MTEAHTHGPNSSPPLRRFGYSQIEGTGSRVNNMTNQMQYKSDYSSIEASTENNCLYGKLQFIRPLVNYEGQAVAKLEAAFHEAVDDYLQTCQELGHNPKISCKGSFNIRAGHDLHLAAALSSVRNVSTLGYAALKTSSECSFTARKLRFLACFRLA